MVKTSSALGAAACCVVLFGAGACTGATGDLASPRPSSSPTTWTWSRVAHDDLPADLQLLDPTSPIEAAGWSHGFVIAGSNRDSSSSVLFTSPDGLSWRISRPDEAVEFSRWPVAAFGASVYVIGADRIGAALWRSEDGSSWRTVDLPGSGESTLSAITAGPRGVVVMGETSDGVRVWHSADGERFAAPSSVLADDPASSPTPPLAADDSGFMLVCCDTAASFVSADGDTWTEVAGLERLRYPGPPGGNGERRIAFGYISGGVPGSGQSADPALPPGLGAWSLSTDRHVWQRGPRIDPGRLPDKGVGSLEDAQISGVTVVSKTFVAAGYEGGMGAVWTSLDGLTWTKQPTAANHFDQINAFDAAGSSGRSVVLVGSSIGDHEFGKTSVWLGRAG